LGCYGLLNSIADFAASHSDEIRSLIKESDKKTIDRGLNPASTDSFPIQYIGKPLQNKVTIKTYEVDVVTDAAGRETYKKSDRKKTVHVPYTARYEATLSVQFPFAYLVNVSDPLVISLLQKHGIQVSQLSKNQGFDVETFKLSDLKAESKLNQGHFNQTAAGVWTDEHREFKAGTFVIRTAQPLANVASYLLEPQSNDGLLKWNFLDRYLVPQWGRGFNPFPVYKIQKRMIIEDTVLPSL
jgi:dipeptidyl-peptidase-4